MNLLNKSGRTRRKKREGIDQLIKKRPGSEKRQKTAKLIIHETKVVQPSVEVPTGSEFKGYQDYTILELMKRAHNIRYRLAMQENPNRRVPEGAVTRTSATLRALWTNSEKLPALSIPPLPCHPTITQRTNEGMGHRHLDRTIKPTVGGRQRRLPCREARHSAGRLECFKLYQHR